MDRLSKDNYFMRVAFTAAERTTCVRRGVGCVLVDFNDHILAVGYNGTAKGMAHCLEFPCAGSGAESGEDLDKCLAVHAEMNALLQCPNPQGIAKAYCSVSPCIWCMRMLMNTSCQEIVYFGEPYDEQALTHWRQSWELRSARSLVV